MIIFILILSYYAFMNSIDKYRYQIGRYLDILLMCGYNMGVIGVCKESEINLCIVLFFLGWLMGHDGG